MISNTKEYRPITLDAFRVAGKDLFAVIVEVDRLMRSYGISSLQFISDVFSTESKHEQIGIIMDALGLVQEKQRKEEGV